MTAKKIGKIAVIALAVVLALVALAAILVKILISPEMVKKTVLPKISDRIERQVTLGDAEVSIFSGIRLKDLVIQEKDGSGPFLKAGAIRLNYRFWPLLAGRVEVNEVLLESPLVKIVRYPDGSFNFSDLKKEKPKTEEPKEKKALHLAVSRAGVSDGKIIYQDRKGIGGQAFTSEVTAIGLAASDISLDGEFPMQLDAVFAGLNISLNGKAAKVGTAPAVTAELALVARDLAAVAKGMPLPIASKLAKAALAGGADIRLKLAGEVKQAKQLLQGGEIKLTELQFNAGKMRPSLSGAITLGKDSAQSKGLTLTAGGQKLAVHVAAKNLLAAPVRLTLDVSADKLDLNQLLPQGKGEAAPQPAKSAPMAEPGPLKLPVEASGSVKVASLLYRTLALENLALDWGLKDNVITVESLKGGAAGGSFSDTARIDLGTKGFSYRTKLEVKGVQADKLVAAFAPKANGALSGTLNLSADVGGRGVTALKRNLVGSGSFDVANGKLSGEGFMPTLAAFLGVDELRVLRFNKLGGNYLIRNETVNLDAKADGADARIAAAGRIGFDKSLDMGIDLRLPPSVIGRAARGNIAKYVADKEGWGSVPLRATGMVNKPGFSLDTAKLGGRVSETLKQKIGEKLLDLERNKGGEPRPERQMLKDTLRGIFGN